MAKPKGQQGFDVAGTQYRQEDDLLASVEQAFKDYRTSIPNRNFTHRTNGNNITIYCHCHEQNLGDPTRRAMQVDALSKATDNFVKGLKKRLREMGAGSIDMAEVKGSRGYDLQKASLNDRWEMVYRRAYEVELTSFPED